MNEQEAKLTPGTDFETAPPPSDVFAFLSRFLPKRTDVLWVAQELERIYRLSDLSQREQAQRDLYLKIEQHIIKNGLTEVTSQELQSKVKAQFNRETKEGFLSPLFAKQKQSVPPKTIATPPTQKIKEDSTESDSEVWQFNQLKTQLGKTGDNPVVAHIKSSSGNVTPATLKGAEWKSDSEGKKQYVIAMKELREVQNYLQQHLRTLLHVLKKAQSGDTSELMAFKPQVEVLRECVDIIKEIEHDRHDKTQKIHQLEQNVLSKEGELKSHLIKLRRFISEFNKMKDELQQRTNELAETKHVAVQNELQWQSRIRELEQEKQDVVTATQKTQEHIATLEKNQKEATKREEKLKLQVKDLEQAKEKALEHKQEVERVKKEIEQFYKKLSQEIV